MIEGQLDPLFVFKTESDGTISSAGYDVTNILNNASVDQIADLVQAGGSSGDSDKVFKNLSIPCGLYCKISDPVLGPRDEPNYINAGIIGDDLYESLLGLVDPKSKSRKKSETETETAATSTETDTTTNDKATTSRKRNTRRKLKNAVPVVKNKKTRRRRSA